MLGILPYLNLIVAVSAMLWAVRVARDTLHPLLFLMPMVLFFHVYKPLNLPADLILSLYTYDELFYAQMVSFLGICALVIGVIYGSRGKVQHTGYQITLPEWLTNTRRRRMRNVSIVFISIAMLMYLFGLSNVGGFVSAYSKVKGGWSTGSGYTRDFIVLIIPGLILLFISKLGRRWSPGDLMIVFASTFPLLVHGLLSGRRGPTFVMLVTIIAGWYLTRGYRPSLMKLSAGILAGGMLLIGLVAYRGDIYLGSDIFQSEKLSANEFSERVGEVAIGRLYGDEFIYSTQMITNAKNEKDYYWGRRVLTILFIRPIPKELWPTKYVDVGMSSLLLNAGVHGTNTNSWRNNKYVVKGAAPGIIADLYVELSWGALVVLFGIGWVYGRSWRKCAARDVFGTVFYSTLLAYSVYLIAQSLGAILAPFVAAMLPTWVAWRYYIRGRLTRHHDEYMERRHVMNADMYKQRK